MTLDELREYIDALQAEYNALAAPVSMQERLEYAFAHAILQHLPLALHNSTSDIVSVLKDSLHANGTCVSGTAQPHSIGTRALIAATQYVAAQINQHACPVVTLNATPRHVMDVDLGTSNSGLIRVPRETRHVLIHRETAPTDLTVLNDFVVGYVRTKKPDALFYVNQTEHKLIKLPLTKTILNTFDSASTGTTDYEILPPAALEYIQTQPGHPKLSELFYVNKQREQIFALNPTQQQLSALDANLEHGYRSMSFREILDFYSEATLFNPLGLIMMPTTLLPTDDQPIQRRLETHILGADALYLIPVEVLRHLTLDSAGIKLYNPAYEEGLPEKYAVLNADELARLETHSSLTEEVFTAKRQYDLLTSDQSNLLGQLRRLDTLLAINDAHGGRGADENAAAGAYPAILDFMSYYQSLDHAQRALIPEGVNREINLLLDYASNPNANANATATLGTCIATRRVQLMTKVAGHEALLSSISMSADTKAALVASAITRFHNAQTDLLKAMKNTTYSGRDHLGITRSLLTELDVRWTISTYDELKLITQLSTLEITEVLQDPALKTQVMQQLSSLENIIIFIIETSAEKTSVFLKAMNHELSRYIRSPIDLAALLVSLEADKIQAVLTALNVRFRELLSSGRDMAQVLRNLSPEQRTVMFTAIQGELPRLCTTARSVGDVLRYLSPDQCTVVLTAIQGELPRLFNTAYNVIDLLRDLSPEQRTVVFTAIQGELPRLFNTAYNVSYLLRDLSPEQRTVVFTAIQDELPRLCETASDVRDVLQYLSPEQRTVVLTAIQGELPRLCATSLNVNHVLYYLSPDQRTVVFNALKNLRLVTIMQNEPAKQNDWMQYLLPSECAELNALFAAQSQANMRQAIQAMQPDHVAPKPPSFK